MYDLASEKLKTLNSEDPNIDPTQFDHMLLYYNDYNGIQILSSKASSVKASLTDAYTPGQLSSYCSATYTYIKPTGTVGKMPPSDQLEAVAIYMTVRQLGASLGVTLVTIVLDRRETLHSSRLFEHLQASATQTQEWMNTTAQAVVQRGGYSPFQAQHMALGLLSELGDRQAATLAYANAFHPGGFSPPGCRLYTCSLSNPNASPFFEFDSLS
jgi:hypothetical protein